MQQNSIYDLLERLSKKIDICKRITTRYNNSNTPSISNNESDDITDVTLLEYLGEVIIYLTSY